jgi:hypothetical protein
MRHKDICQVNIKWNEDEDIFYVKLKNKDAEDDGGLMQFTLSCPFDSTERHKKLLKAAKRLHKFWREQEEGKE